MVKNPPAMWETWIQSPGREDPLEKGKATHSSILTRRIPWFTKSQTLLRDLDFHKVKRRRGWQRMRWLDSLSNSVDMNLSKLQEIA